MADTIEIYKGENGLYYVDEIFPNGHHSCKGGGYPDIGGLLWGILYGGFFYNPIENVKFGKSFLSKPKKYYPEKSLVRNIIREHEKLTKIKEALRKNSP